MPDNLNPIFVLHTRLTYNIFRHWWKEMIAAYLLLSMLVLCFFSPTGFPHFLIIPLFLCLLVGGVRCFTGAFSRMSQLYVDGDLIHYTAMTDKEVLWGYFQVAFFRSGVLYGIGLLMFFWTIPFQDIGDTLETLAKIPLLYVFCFTIGLVSASFHAGVRKHHERTILPIAQAFLFLVFFIFGPSGAAFQFLTELGSTSAFMRWVFSAYTIVLIAVTAYYLTMSNVKRKINFGSRMALTLGAYLFIFFVLWLISFITFYWWSIPWWFFR